MPFHLYEVTVKAESKYLVEPKSKLRLKKIATDDKDGFESEEESLGETQKNIARLASLQEELAAAQSNALLVVLQGMDTAGKDGTIRHIFTGVNPQGCSVTSFKVPTPLEARHDFLWRVHAAVPPRGMIGIFNRSHYEDVLVTRVHKTITQKQAKRRFQDIVNFEELLVESGTVVVKLFLHISQKEQTARLQSRMDTADKRWKLSAADFAERKYWDSYQQAYQDAIAATSRKGAPWYIVPSDHKWYRNVVVSRILVKTLEAMKLKYPRPDVDIGKLKL